MGKLSVQVINESASFVLAGGANNTQDMKSGILSSKPDIILDVTRSDVVMSHMHWLIKQQKSLLIGTSGITEDDKRQIQDWCHTHNTTCWLVPNFSIGANLMMNFSEIAAKYFQQAKITEYHHSSKIDAPSQTARHTKQLLEKNNLTVAVESVRNDRYQAEQTVLLNTAFESLCIEHKSFDHKSYTAGIKHCLEKISAMHGYHHGINIL